MPQNFGELSFRKGSSTVVGLPLDVIDKVGANLTEHYTRNRQAVSKIKESVLALPDANSDVNKEIISKLSSEVKDSFSKYAQEGNWWEADDAVYNAADKLAGSQEVKDLIKYSGQAAKVDDQIEKSGASEYYKNIRRKMNQETNVGIRDKSGNSLSYQGRGLAGDLNTTKYLKTVNDLVSGWKADKDAKVINPSSFEGRTLSDGYKMVMNSFGKESIEKVDEASVRNFIMSTMLNDPNFNAEVNDIAELNLYAKTGKLNPESADVVNVMLEQSKNDPMILGGMIAHSKEFIAATAKMGAVDKSKYMSKIMGDDTLKDSYLRSGLSSFTDSVTNHFGKDSRAYKLAYTNFVRAEQLNSFEGLVDKTAYTSRDVDMHFDESSLNQMMYKKHLETLDSIPIVNPTGQTNTGNASKHFDIRGETISTISQLQAQRDLAKDPSIIEDYNRKIGELQGKLRLNNMYTDQMVKQLGLTNDVLFQKHEKDIKQSISGYLGTGSGENPSIGMSIGMGMAPSITPTTNTNRKNTSKELDVIYNAVRDNYSDPEKALDVITKSGISINKNNLNRLYGNINRVFENTVSDGLKNFKGDIASIPLESVDYLGSDPKDVTNLKEFFIKNYKAGNGTMLRIDSWDKDRMNTTNINNDSELLYTKGKVKGNETMLDNKVEVSLLTANMDDPSLNQQPLLQFKVYDNEHPNGRSEIVAYTGDLGLVKDVYKSTVKNSVKSAADPKNNYPSPAKRSAYVMAGQYVSDLPISGLDGENANGSNIGTVLANLPETFRDGDNVKYKTVTINYGGQDLTFVTSRTGNKFHSQLYKGIVTNPQSTSLTPIIEVPNATSPSSILQFFGADLLRRESLSSGDAATYSNITKVFDLQPLK